MSAKTTRHKNSFFPDVNSMAPESPADDTLLVLRPGPIRHHKLNPSVHCGRYPHDQLKPSVCHLQTVTEIQRLRDFNKNCS